MDIRMDAYSLLSRAMLLLHNAIESTPPPNYLQGNGIPYSGPASDETLLAMASKPCYFLRVKSVANGMRRFGRIIKAPGP
jgi:hypothetical protein